MWRASWVATPPADEPVAIERVRVQIGLAPDDASRDADLALWIATAREQVEQRCAVALITQTVVMIAGAFCDLERLPMAPLQSITSIGATAPDGTSLTIDPTVYEAQLYGLEPGIVLRPGKTWPGVLQGAPITITAMAGYGDEAADVPASLQSAILLMVAEADRDMAGQGLLQSEEVDGVSKVQFARLADVRQAAATAIDRLIAPYRRWPIS